MTEAEWLACEDPDALLGSLLGEQSERKLRLLALACCRRVGHLFIGRRCWWAIEIGERYADKLVTEADLAHASAAAFQAFVAETGPTARASSAVWAATAPATEGSVFGAEFAPRYTLDVAFQAGDAVESQHEERHSQSGLVRDIFGNPFRPVTFSPAWRTDTALSLARQMYESRDFSAMPILADALQDAGCDSDDVLNHCRGPGSHVRGCWVCDLVLEKE
jgi:hypothetical protein